MNKEEILAKSRKENKDQDIYEKIVTLMMAAGHIYNLISSSTIL